MDKTVTLVVGTTPDYIDWLRRVAPGRALFLTDPLLRRQAREPAPGADEEIPCDLADVPGTEIRLEEHLARWGLVPDGIACFDCESLELAAMLAERYRLPYPTPAAVRLCRDKYRAKLRWQEGGLGVPRACLVLSPEEAGRFGAGIGNPVVLKPLTGSGSEQVWLCRSGAECRTRYTAIASALQDKGTHRLYRPSLLSPSPETAGGLIVGEEFIAGEEYSADFWVDGERLEPIRLTRKFRAPDGPFGTTLGYLLCDGPPEGIGPETFVETLRRCAAALDVRRAVCMLDFIVRDREMVLLEMAPRPGGDCLPQLLLQARGIDMLRFCLDFAARRDQGPIPGPSPFIPGCMGVRILARQGGVLRRIDTAALQRDPRVVEIGLTKGPGHVIVMPPADYDAWVLGYAIVRMKPGQDIAGQLLDLTGKIDMVMG